MCQPSSTPQFYFYYFDLYSQTPRLVYEDVATATPPSLRRPTSRRQWCWPHDHPCPLFSTCLIMKMVDTAPSLPSASSTTADAHSRCRFITFISDGADDGTCPPPQPLRIRSTPCCCTTSSNGVNIGETATPHPHLRVDK